MPTIYGYNNEFDSRVIIDKVNDISNELEEEQQKPFEERNKKREFDLINQQFIQALKFSTGYCNLWKR